MASVLTFLERYHKGGHEFLSHIVQARGDETWVSFVVTKQQSKQWMHTHSPNKPKKFKQTFSCHKADGSCFLGQEKLSNGGIMQKGTIIASEVYYEALKESAYFVNISPEVTFRRTLVVMTFINFFLQFSW
jgi:hypothetical protein